jgi:hypothetical protein
VRALAKGEERHLFGGAGSQLRRAGQVPTRVARVVRIDDPRGARGGQGVPGDLGQPTRRAADDDQLVADHPAPHLRPDMAGWGGVAHRPEPDGLVVVDQPFLTQRDRVRLAGQHVQVPPLDHEPVDRRGPGFAVRPGVDPAHTSPHTPAPAR